MNQRTGSQRAIGPIIGSEYITVTRTKTKKTTEVTTTRTVETTKTVTKTQLPPLRTDTISIATPPTTILPSSPSFSRSSTPSPSVTTSSLLSSPPQSPVAHRLNEYVAHIPRPSEIQPPADGLEPTGFWLITVGQEVGIFYDWAEVQLRTSKVSGATQYKCSSFQDAMTRYTSYYDRGLLRAVPVPNGPFWPTTQTRSRAMSATSARSDDSDELWSQVDDISEHFTNLLVDDE
ncbi:hypothetical protein BJ138DRAFT_1118670 [Hygrophoropsis aurantiaca]|uniref:Uncharacterized protein n=1 Tax=Hygrophoropsis aurantiaca TaxID=72124 RepID=A0ACB7ZWU6_9AGAM|nr:hypothetical protein BJ138DRAFT_1118670 [Hygrophoropsis aurantiaca]